MLTGQHLRDGFTRAIAARQKIARSAGQLTDADEEASRKLAQICSNANAQRIAQSTQTLKALFPAQSVPKGKALTLLRRPDGALTIEYEVRCYYSDISQTLTDRLLGEDTWTGQ